jgi:exopolysaccharide production protein ExoQ
VRGVVEKVLIVLLLLYYLAPFFGLLDVEGEGHVSSGSASGEYAPALTLNLTINGVAALLLIFRSRLCVLGLRRAGWVIGLPALAFLSVLWSANPFFTFRILIHLTIGTALGAYLGARYSRAELLRLVAWTMTIVAILSIALALLAPELGMAQAEEQLGGWKGILITKNVLARAMALGALVFLVLPISRKKNAIKLSGFLTCVAIVFLTKSVGGMLGLLVVVMVAVALSLMTRKLPAMKRVAIQMLCLITAGILVFLVVTNWSSVLAVTGRDATLTGRIGLWRALLQACAQKPFLGYGWGGFWNDPAGLKIVYDIGLQSPHNGVLDLCLQLGIFGLVVFAVGFLMVLYRAVLCVREERGSDAAWPICYLTFLVMFNITEATGMDVNSFYWLLYVAVAAAPAMTSRMPFARKQARQPNDCRVRHCDVQRISII